MKRLVVAAAAMLAIGAVIAVGVMLWLASDVGLGSFTPPSDAQVRRDVEHFYANADGDPRRPAGVLRGCFSRHAGLWFYCEFNAPTVKAATRITCVEVNVDEPCCSREQGRWLVADIARAKSVAANGGSICG